MCYGRKGQSEVGGGGGGLRGGIRYVFQLVVQ